MANTDMILWATIGFTCLTFFGGYVSVDFVACQTRISSPSFFTNISNNLSSNNTRGDSNYTCINNEMFLYIQNGSTYIYWHSVQLFLVLLLHCLLVDIEYSECAQRLWNSLQKRATIDSQKMGEKSGEATVVSRNQTACPSAGSNTDSTECSKKHYTAAELHAIATASLQLIRIIASTACGCLIVYSLQYLIVKATPLPESAFKITQPNNLSDEKKSSGIYELVRAFHTLLAGFTVLLAVASILLYKKEKPTSEKLTIRNFQAFLDWFHSSPPFMQQLRSLSFQTWVEFLKRAVHWAPFVLIVYWNVASCVTLVQQFTHKGSQQDPIRIDSDNFLFFHNFLTELMFFLAVQLFGGLPVVCLIVERVELNNGARSGITAQ